MNRATNNAAAAARLLGKLQVVPGAALPLISSRPTANPGFLQRFVAGRSAASVPDLLAAVFALCAEQHRQTARRALDAALGMSVDENAHQYEALYQRAACLREHMVHLALHLPRTGHELDLRSLPPPVRFDAGPTAVTKNLTQLKTFVDEHVLGQTPSLWTQRYGTHDLTGVARWAEAEADSQPVAAWLHEIRARASALKLELPTQGLLDNVSRDLPLLAAELQTHERDHDRWAEQALFLGKPAESGPFSRSAWPLAQRKASSAYDLLAARIVDIVQCCRDATWLRSGVLALGPGQAIAYTELARGLLLHWVQLSVPVRSRTDAIVADYRVITPTDFCLHPDGALATRLRSPKLARRDVQLLVAAFDPCLDVEIALEESIDA